MILFYSETITERIKYVVHFILKEQMGIWRILGATCVGLGAATIRWG